MDFSTNIKYTDRQSKSRFVFEKYKDILKGRILDVGADELYLKNHLPKGIEYKGIGFGDNPDLIEIDLEKGYIPSESNSFDCVLCLDVLEHLENIHEVFDELCRVSDKYVIISLPNPWSDFMATLRFKKYRSDRNMKFYGLPLEREPDRHKWFYSSGEAKEFVEYRAAKNNYQTLDLYISNEGAKGYPRNMFLKILTAPAIYIIQKLFFRNDLNLPDIYESTMWWVLEKKE
jgi:hypothetical protein